jgi:AmiR/NasT family two-component response regulator
VSVLLARQQQTPSDTAERVSASSSVYQATGMVMVQLGTDGEAAFAALRARAYQEGRTLAEVARDVIERRVRFAEEEV